MYIFPSGYRSTHKRYATFCNLAGIDPADAVAAAHGLPPIDSADLWPLLVGSNTTSPHTTLPIVVDFVPPQLKAVIGNSSAILHSDRWKLLEGTQLLSYWQGPAFPNASGYGRYFQPFHACSPACLYDIVADPGEHNDVSTDHPEIVSMLQDALADARKTMYQRPPQSDTAGSHAAILRYGNFWGPWLP